jgi:hypothetical protein
LGKAKSLAKRSWVLHVLAALLGYPVALLTEGQTLPAGLEAKIPEFGETLRPDFALVGPAGGKTAGQAQLLILSYPPNQELDHPVLGKHWKANPATRAVELLHASGVPLGLVTNGEQWMLVFAPRGETTAYASWYSPLWFDEPITLRAFQSLLGVRRFFGVSTDGTLLGLLKESAQDQQEVTDQLGYQVREAVEVLVQALDTLDLDSKRTLLKNVSEKTLYEAALTVMMRLVFLFSAEERGLLHLGKPLYDDNYAVSTLIDQLQEAADLYGPQVLERRVDAWARLIATFRAVHGGIQHQDLLMPAYGGSLFDPDRFPFLEGRAAGTNWRTMLAPPIAVNNRVALHLLTSLQRLRIKLPGDGPSEARRISFRALGVEQIGHVYEGLLDHTAVRASETVVGLKGTRANQAEIPLATIEAAFAQGEERLLEFLKEQTGRSTSALKRALADESPFDEHKLRIATGHDAAVVQRVRPFAGLIREDSFERPMIIPPDSMYVTTGTARRSTGTHYTPPSLTEPIVQSALEPLVYEGPSQGTPREHWILKAPAVILDLKVCDMAMGSGAFLVQACRYLAERLVEAWENEEKKHPDEVLVTPDGEFSKGLPSERLVPQDPNERLAVARRLVADRCLYGVDINPMAVEMAKLSLWLITLDGKRPFTFLDHAFKSGDSLLGVISLSQLEEFSLRPGGGKQFAFSTMNLWRHIGEAAKSREALEAMPSDTPEHVKSKSILYAEAETAVSKLRAAADILSGMEIRTSNSGTYDLERVKTADRMMEFWADGKKALEEFAKDELKERKPLHWPLAFPEIIGRGGFDACLGNPPFIYGTLATTALGEDYMGLLQLCSPPWHGKSDIVVGFFKRAASLLRSNGCFSFIATASILRGESLECGLRDLIAKGWTVYSARSPFTWPGTANLEVVTTSFAKGWNGKYMLDGAPVVGIAEDLTEGNGLGTPPYELARQSVFGALGIKLCPANRELEYSKYLREEQSMPEIRDFYVPTIGGEELYDLVNWSVAPRSIDPEKLSEFLECGGRLSQHGTIRIGEPRSYAHSAPASALRLALTKTKYAFACGETSTTLRFTKVPKADCILKHKLIVFPSDNWGLFAILQSDLHAAWAWRWGLRRKKDLVYSPKRCAATFPLPGNLTSLDGIAEAYYEYRQYLVQSRQEGLTKIYNLFHDPTILDPGIVELRKKHTEMDQAVAAAYEWHEDLSHDHYQTSYGVRFTVSEQSRRVALDRLLALNHQLHGIQSAVGANLGVVARRSRKAEASGDTDSSTLFV